MASATLVNHASVPLGGRKDATPATSPASSLSLDFPRININRLWEDIQRTAQWGEILNSPGLSRLALSKDDQQVREWFCAEASQLGCEVKVDMMGNIFAILPGCVPGLAPIGMGSHLDSQPLGGRYDGVLGVIAGLEVLRTVKAAGIKNRAPLAVINWTNEEGARFFPGCSGSAVWSGWMPLERAYQLQGRVDSTTPSLTTLGTALREIAQNGSTPCDHTVNPLQAHFELHIEQGPLLEQEQKLIGVVHSIHEIRRYNVAVNGRRGHAGTVPMAERTDALMAACRVALMVEQAAIEHSAFATVGTWSIEEPSPNVIPGRVEFTLDVRHPCRATMCDLEKALHRITKEMMQHIPALQIELSCAWESPAATFDERAVGCVRSAAKQAAGEGSVMPMKSLAGHDTALTAMRVPSAMIFVPSRGGISHAPEEFTSKSHCGLGAQTLLRAVLEYDSRYSE